MKLTQVDNGLSLSKMVLCQLCGLPLNDEIRLADEDVESLTLPEYHVGDNVATALANREELRSLDLANKFMTKSQYHKKKLLIFGHIGKNVY